MADARLAVVVGEHGVLVACPGGALRAGIWIKWAPAREIARPELSEGGGGVDRHGFDFRFERSAEARV